MENNKTRYYFYKGRSIYRATRGEIYSRFYNTLLRNGIDYQNIIEWHLWDDIPQSANLRIKIYYNRTKLLAAKLIKQL